MSNPQNEAILENFFEEGLEIFKGDEKKAEQYARDRFDQLPEPDYKAHGGEVESMMDRIKQKKSSPNINISITLNMGKGSEMNALDDGNQRDIM